LGPSILGEARFSAGLDALRFCVGAETENIATSFGKTAKTSVFEEL
jgi:hypothetical protein